MMYHGRVEDQTYILCLLAHINYIKRIYHKGKEARRGSKGLIET
jgi:hypothetical protein